MSKTQHYQFEKPDEEKTVEQEVRNLQSVLELLDTILHGFRTDVDGKSAKDHGHNIANIEDLKRQLSDKMAANKTFSLDDLTDVDGAAEAALGYILVKTVSGWVAQSGLSAIGEHEHAIKNIKNLATELGKRALLGDDGKVISEQLPDGLAKASDHYTKNQSDDRYVRSLDGGTY